MNNNLKSGPGEFYMRPGGFLSGISAQNAVGQGKAGVVGGGWSAFTSAEIIRRTGDKIERQWLVYSDFNIAPDEATSKILNKIEAPCAVPQNLSQLNLRPAIMGIVNVTPDSFSDGGEFFNIDAGVAHGLNLIRQGADIIDIGGESTRPGAEPISIKQEIDRVVPVIAQLKEAAKKAGVLISIDTRNGEVMRAAIKAGAGFVNDVTALSHCPKAMQIVADAGLPVCLMHSQGTPQTMQDNPQYGDVVLDVHDYLARRIDICVAAGIAIRNIMIDPGIGFGKSVAHNIALIEQISIFHAIGVPILLGASRKSFIGAIDDEPMASKRLPGSLTVATHAVNAGVQVIRVHDVAETVQALKISMAISG